MDDMESENSRPHRDPNTYPSVVAIPTALFLLFLCVSLNACLGLSPAVEAADELLLISEQSEKERPCSVHVCTSPVVIQALQDFRPIDRRPGFDSRHYQKKK
jgi:hypothetical protein